MCFERDTRCKSCGETCGTTTFSLYPLCPQITVRLEDEAGSVGLPSMGDRAILASPERRTAVPEPSGDRNVAALVRPLLPPAPLRRDGRDREQGNRGEFA